MMTETLAGVLGFAALPVPVIWGLGLLLVVTILWDLRQMRIPNRLVLLFVLLFAAAVAPFLTVSELALRLAVALLVLAVFVAAFAAGLIGGGDVKLLAALVLFVPPGTYTLFAFVLSLSLLICTGLLLVSRRVLPAAGHGWQFLQERRRLPMGPAFGAAGLLFWGLLLA